MPELEHSWTHIIMNVRVKLPGGGLNKLGAELQPTFGLATSFISKYFAFITIPVALRTLSDDRGIISSPEFDDLFFISLIDCIDTDHLSHTIQRITPYGTSDGLASHFREWVGVIQHK